MFCTTITHHVHFCRTVYVNLRHQTLMMRARRGSLSAAALRFTARLGRRLLPPRAAVDFINRRCCDVSVRRSFKTSRSALRRSTSSSSPSSSSSCSPATTQAISAASRCSRGNRICRIASTWTPARPTHPSPPLARASETSNRRSPSSALFANSIDQVLIQ